ncbi:DUF2793 domain-containing protein [Falsihalocynthiibacter sp. SS001]|uniref:DUF2793 domain-containing protein n=1 Tax=Falsihalocynthiibacter sp. SS001 TaxID=3349698 RepID=UPI0036D272B8
MTNTANLGLPLVQPSQAQKHVTVNESLVRLDGLTQLVLESVNTVTPPLAAEEGTCYAVPIGAVNAWAGHEGKVAIQSNGGWVFVTPQVGWQGWIADQSQAVRFNGMDWVGGVVSQSANGAASGFSVFEFDHTISAGSTDTTIPAIPPYAMVFGVTGRVIESITGSLTDWSLGKAGAPTQFGSGLGLASESYVRGTLSYPSTEYAPTELLLTANGGSFSGGSVRLAVHYFHLTIPNIS